MDAPLLPSPAFSNAISTLFTRFGCPLPIPISRLPWTITKQDEQHLSRTDPHRRYSPPKLTTTESYADCHCHIQTTPVRKTPNRPTIELALLPTLYPNTPNRPTRLPVSVPPPYTHFGDGDRVALHVLHTKPRESHIRHLRLTRLPLRHHFELHILPGDVIGTLEEPPSRHLAPIPPNPKTRQRTATPTELATLAG